MYMQTHFKQIILMNIYITVYTLMSSAEIEIQYMILIWKLTYIRVNDIIKWR